MEFIWDDPKNPCGNVAHIMAGHPEIPIALLEKVFSTASGDEDIYQSKGRKKRYLVVEKTYRKKLYRIVFEKVGEKIKIRTGFRISKRRKVGP